MCVSLQASVTTELEASPLRVRPPQILAVSMQLLPPPLADAVQLGQISIDPKQAAQHPLLALEERLPHATTLAEHCWPTKNPGLTVPGLPPSHRMTPRHWIRADIRPGQRNRSSRLGAHWSSDERRWSGQAGQAE